MSAIQWAKTVRCDWPDCQAEAEVTLRKDWPDRKMPEGWISLRPAVLAALGGRDVGELCTIHSRFTIAQLLEVMTS